MDLKQIPVLDPFYQMNREIAFTRIFDSDTAILYSTAIE